MKLLTWALAGAVAAFALAGSPVLAADQVGYATSSTNPNTVAVSPQNPLPVTGSFSATTACKSTAAAPTYTEGTTTNPISCDLSGNVRTIGSGVATAANQSTMITSLSTIATNSGSAIPAGTNVIGYMSADPCSQAAKSYADFSSTTSGGSIITAVSAKKAYICSVSIIASAATNVSLIEGTGASVCTAGTTAGVYLNTGVSAANGAAVAANGGIQAGNGSGTIAANGTANQNVCVAFTTTNSPQVNVHVAYVQQ